MAGRGSYKTTLFDREGPDAGIKIKAYSYAAIAGGLSVPVFFGFSSMAGLGPAATMALVILGPVLLTFGVGKMVLRMLRTAGEAVRVVLEGGSSTPYTEQYSYQQTLVMQGRLDEALESYEAIMAEPESAVDVKIRAAELYAREAKRYDRAAELLRAAIRHPKCSPSEEVYSARRLADLLSGPLNQPGRALVELRRIADRYKGTNVGDHALEAIRLIKSGGPKDLYKAAESETTGA
jgi:tetratricopeptide (TPR) repeat protein